MEGSENMGMQLNNEKKKKERETTRSHDARDTRGGMKQKWYE